MRKLLLIVLLLSSILLSGAHMPSYFMFETTRLYSFDQKVFHNIFSYEAAHYTIILDYTTYNGNPYCLVLSRPNPPRRDTFFLSATVYNEIQDDTLLVKKVHSINPKYNQLIISFGTFKGDDSPSIITLDGGTKFVKLYMVNKRDL